MIRMAQTITSAATLLAALLVASPSSAAVTPIKIRCPQVIEGEFTAGDQWHRYELKMAAAEQIKIRAAALGDYLKFRIIVQEPLGQEMLKTYDRNSHIETTRNLSANGIYVIYVTNENTGQTGIYTLHVGCVKKDGSVIEADQATAEAPSIPTTNAPGEASLDSLAGTLSQTPGLEGYAEDVNKISAYAGAAQEVVGVLKSVKGLFGGKKKKAQQQNLYGNPNSFAPQPVQPPTYQAPPPAPPAQPVQQHAPAPQPKAVGLVPMQEAAAPQPTKQGLQPSALAAMLLPQISPQGIPLQGKVTAAGNEVVGCRFEAQAGQSLDVELQRLSGDLHLDVMLVGPNGEVALESTLRGGRRMASSVDLESAGLYTVAVVTSPGSAGHMDTGFTLTLSDSELGS